jgi:hypothetical protein
MLEERVLIRNGNKVAVMPAQAGISNCIIIQFGIPAFAGMTNLFGFVLVDSYKDKFITM